MNKVYINAGKATTNFGYYSYPRIGLSRIQVGKANFVITDLLVTESFKDTKWGYFGAHILVREKGHSFQNFL